MIQLEAHGISAGYVRDHSLDRFLALSHAVAGRRKRDTASSLMISTLAALVGGGSKDAADTVLELMDELSEDDSTTNHLLDPNAQTDWDAVRRFAGDPDQKSVAVMRVKREEATS